MALDSAMQQVVEVTLGILPTTTITPDLVLNHIADYTESNATSLLRVTFEKRRQGPSGHLTRPIRSFDDFFSVFNKRRGFMCEVIIDSRLVTCIIAVTRDTDTKKKLLARRTFI